MDKEAFEDNVTNLMMAISTLTRRVRAAVASHDLSMSQTMVMARLAKDGSFTAADLARAEGMKPQSMGTVIAELEELGLVRRKPHPTDGRQRMIELTDKGLAVRKLATQEKKNWVSHAVEQLNEQEQQTLFEAGRIIHRMIEE